MHEDLSGSDVLTLMVQADVDEDGDFDGPEDLTLYDSEPLDLGSETLVLTEWTDSAPIVNSTACRLSLIRPSIGSVDDSLAGGGFVGNVRRSVDFVFDP